MRPLRFYTSNVRMVRIDEIGNRVFPKKKTQAYFRRFVSQFRRQDKLLLVGCGVKESCLSPGQVPRNGGVKLKATYLSGLHMASAKVVRQWPAHGTRGLF